jgi:glycosyltransferase involved in cell wall biosynthesis
MKIAFDSQIFTMQVYGGISRYICSLAAQLAKIEGVEPSIIAPFYVNAYLEKLPKQIFSGIKIPKISKAWLVFHLVGLWLARERIAKNSPQIVHETYYSAQSSAPKSARTVVTVYDMIHEHFASGFSQNDRTSKLKMESVLRADHVICISENTRNDLLNLLPVSPDRVSVAYLGFDRFDTPIEGKLSRSLNIEMPYLLYVGQRGGYKNFNAFLLAFASSSWLIKNFRIVCIGGKKLQSDELNLMRELGISSLQVMQIKADDHLLIEYYRNAAAFIYPSQYEGFGIPPLEAMSLNCPVICSNTSSIPEVVGEAGEYFEPDRVDSIRDAIERVLEDKGRRESLVQKGIERCKIFSWERCASETLGIYRSII